MQYAGICSSTENRKIINCISLIFCLLVYNFCLDDKYNKFKQ